MKRIVGLVGTGKGPRLFIGPAQKLVVEIRGQKTGAVRVRVIYNAQEDFIQFFREEGDFEIPVGPFVEFEYEGECNPICAIKVA